MSIKKLIIMVIIFLSLCSCLTFYTLYNKDDNKVDVVAVNDIAQTLGEQWDNLGHIILPAQSYGLEYSVVDENDNFIAATKDGLDNDINSAIRNRDTIVNIKVNDKVLGKLIVCNNTDNILKQERTLLMFITY